MPIWYGRPEFVRVQEASMGSPDLFSIGSLKVELGTNVKNYKGVSAGTAYFARGGDDSLSAKTTYGITHDGRWWIDPSLISGGEGSDEYSVTSANGGSYQFAIIADNGGNNGNNDLIYYTGYLNGMHNGLDLEITTIERQHALLRRGTDTTILIIDGLNNRGSIERLVYSDPENDFQATTVDISHERLLSLGSAIPDYSWERILNEGIFYPPVIGIENNADSVRQEIEKFRSLGEEELTIQEMPRNKITTRSWSAVVRDNSLHSKRKRWTERHVDELGYASYVNYELIQAAQVSKENFDFGPTGARLSGPNGPKNTIRGLAGWDYLKGSNGSDLIHGGNGRDIIWGSEGSDELHGDFGWNTFGDERDGSKDLIAIKSDQHLYNWWYGKAGNSPNGEKADFIEGLDSTDEIKIIGVYTSDITFKEDTVHRGIRGIGIYAKGTLEAVYTTHNLSIDQLRQMTTGDASADAMNNKVWSYWSSNESPALL